MIKRRFYKVERGDRDNASDSSSFSSNSELEVETPEESEDTGTEESEEDAVSEKSEDDSAAQLKKNNQSCSTSSGYESEDSSGNEAYVDSADFVNEDAAATGRDRERATENQLPYGCSSKLLERKYDSTSEKEPISADIPACMIKRKSVFRCRICPRIVCLNEETMRAHVNSKKHARSEKLLKEGRLKAILNSDGEIENQEIPERSLAPVIPSAQDEQKDKSKRSCWQRKNSKRRKKQLTNLGGKQSADLKPERKPFKKRHKDKE